MTVQGRLPQAADSAAERRRARQRSAAKRQLAGAWNRRLGWILLPIVLTAVTMHYLGAQTGTANTVVLALQFTFVPLWAVHTALSVYVFGWVRPALTLRVFHIWFGYAYIGLVLLSQTTFGIEPLHAIATVAMFAALATHVGIGIYYARWRRRGVLLP